RRPRLDRVTVALGHHDRSHHHPTEITPFRLWVGHCATPASERAANAPPNPPVRLVAATPTPREIVRHDRTHHPPAPLPRLRTAPGHTRYIRRPRSSRSPTGRTQPALRARLAQPGAVPRRPHLRRLGRDRPARRLLRGTPGRRRLENHQ